MKILKLPVVVVNSTSLFFIIETVIGDVVIFGSVLDLVVYIEFIPDFCVVDGVDETVLIIFLTLTGSPALTLGNKLRIILITHFLCLLFHVHKL